MNVKLVPSTYGFDHPDELTKDPLQLLPAIALSQLSGLGCSAHILKPHDLRPFEQQMTDKYTPCPAHLLDGFSISHSPASNSVMPFIKPLDKDKQRHVQTTTAQFTATDSFVSGGHVFPTLKEENVAHKYKSSKARYAASERGKIARARYLASERGKACRARISAKYAATDKGKANRAKCQAKYLATDKGQKNSARARAKYAASVKGKLRQAICNAKSNTYQSAIRKGFSKKEARKQGELAANNKREELSSMLSSSLSSQC